MPWKLQDLRQSDIILFSNNHYSRGGCFGWSQIQRNRYRRNKSIMQSGCVIWDQLVLILILVLETTQHGTGHHSGITSTETVLYLTVAKWMEFQWRFWDRTIAALLKVYTNCLVWSDLHLTITHNGLRSIYLFEHEAGMPWGKANLFEDFNSLCKKG